MHSYKKRRQGTSALDPNPNTILYDTNCVSRLRRKQRYRHAPKLLMIIYITSDAQSQALALLPLWLIATMQ